MGGYEVSIATIRKVLHSMLKDPDFESAFSPREREALESAVEMLADLATEWGVDAGRLE